MNSVNKALIGSTINYLESKYKKIEGFNNICNLLSKIEICIEQDILIAKNNPQMRHSIRKTNILSKVIEKLLKKDLYYDVDYYVSFVKKNYNKFEDSIVTMSKQGYTSFIYVLLFILQFILNLDGETKFIYLYKCIDLVIQLSNSRISRIEKLYKLIQVIDIPQNKLDCLNGDSHIFNVLNNEIK